MTGFDSKRKMAQAKMNDDDDTQVYSDTLLVVYQRGFTDGKKAAQRQWVGLTDEERRACTQSPFTADNYRAIEAKLKERNT